MALFMNGLNLSFKTSFIVLDSAFSSTGSNDKYWMIKRKGNKKLLSTSTIIIFCCSNETLLVSSDFDTFSRMRANLPDPESALIRALSSSRFARWCCPVCRRALTKRVSADLPLVSRCLSKARFTYKRKTRWYPWGIQSPHTSTDRGGVLGKLRSELRKES